MAGILLPASGPSSMSQLVITAPSGSTVTCSKDGVTKTATGKASKNRINYLQLESGSKSGYKFTVLDGGIFVTGKSTVSSGWVVLFDIPLTLAAGTYKTSGRVIAAESRTIRNEYRITNSDGTVKILVDDSDAFTLDGTEKSVTYRAVITVSALNQYEEGFIQPMVVAGSTEASFEPYYEGIRFRFTRMDVGTWTIRATKGEQSVAKAVTIDQPCTEYIDIAYNVIPKFTYSGTYKIVDDAGNTITTSSKNYNIMLLTSGTLVFTEMTETSFDVFMIAGGGASRTTSSDSVYYADGGDYKTIKGKTLAVNTNYAIVIGAGGTDSGDGGNTTAFGNSVAGSEGGLETRSPIAGVYAFEAETGTIVYGGSTVNPGPGAANTGSGGYTSGLLSGTETSQDGGSGVVILRNKR